LCEKLRSQEIEQAFTRKSDPVFLLRSDPALAREELSFRTSQISFCQPPTSQSGGTSRAVQLPKLSPANGVLDCKQKKKSGTRRSPQVSGIGRTIIEQWKEHIREQQARIVDAGFDALGRMQ